MQALLRSSKVGKRPKGWPTTAETGGEEAPRRAAAGTAAASRTLLPTPPSTCPSVAGAREASCDRPSRSWWPVCPDVPLSGDNYWVLFEDDKAEPNKVVVQPPSQRWQQDY
ncbi:hypothetical protein DIPPA_29414 [Diplonema papillatum]|nr:hypothetical protein DIPPA_29414 [Diplonema papillatum]